MKIAASWYEVLKEELKKPYIEELKHFLKEEEKKGKVVYPPEPQIFNAFLHTPFNEVKVVVMGQDPYHGPGQAQGLCFSVPEGVPPPPSLRNIFLELEKDLGITRNPMRGCLAPWAKQGVLLLNAILTVEQGSPASHQKKGWEELTDKVIEILSARKDPLVFLLWGKYAQDKCIHFLKEKETPHLILTAPHPSPFSAHQGFLGCGHFSKANTFLEKQGKPPINWAL